MRASLVAAFVLAAVFSLPVVGAALVLISEPSSAAAASAHEEAAARRGVSETAAPFK